MSWDPAWSLYALPLLLIWFYMFHRDRRETSRSLALQRSSIDAGLHEPASLHPVINPGKCMGCGACVNACPEGSILGLINGKAALVEPSSCIGHGACKVACPFDAITLVFGTATRGIDLPVVKSNFETNVPGIFVAGELGGMGLIRNAVEQGRQAVASLAASVASNATEATAGMVDVIIVGAGPAGFSASLAAKEIGLSFLTFDQETLGGTVAHFPRGKLVMSRPAKLPILGVANFDKFPKEKLLAFWKDAQQKAGLQINFNEGVEAITPREGGGFSVRTSQNTYAARTILLAIGRRGSARKLGVPGEDLDKVVYNLIDPEQYRGRRVLVVGGGDSALEAAVALAGEEGTRVHLAYRGEALRRCKAANRDALEKLVRARRVDVLYETDVVAIEQHAVLLSQKGRRIELPNDDVIICAGGILPADFLRTMGIKIETKYGTA